MEFSGPAITDSDKPHPHLVPLADWESDEPLHPAPDEVTFPLWAFSPLIDYSDPASEKPGGEQLLSGDMEFRPDWIKPIGKNRIDDFTPPIVLRRRPTPFPFSQSNRTWAGGQRKGIRFNPPDSSPNTDFVDRALGDPSHLADPVPLPDEISDSIAFLKNQRAVLSV